MGGGTGNTASGFASAVGGGQGNTASGDSASVGGGQSNMASGHHAAVGGGSSNTATSDGATVGGGLSNIASGLSTVGGGIGNIAGCLGTEVSGPCAGQFASGSATVPGGINNNALGGFSFAAGRRAKANHAGTFVWGDSTNADIASTAADQFIIRASGGVGIGSSNPDARLHVLATTTSSGNNTAVFTAPNIGPNASNIHFGTNGDWFIRSASSAGMVVIQDSGGNVGIGDSSPDAKLDVEVSNAAVAAFNRLTTDGAVISIQQDNVEEGVISVAGTMVSYNAFTGSHYGWTNEPIDRGMLVRLTGENKSSHDRPGSEPVYGVVKSTRANDAAILGAYLGRQEPGKPDEPVTENPHLVMAVGNGEMWVVDRGRHSAGRPTDLVRHSWPRYEGQRPLRG